MMKRIFLALYSLLFAATLMAAEADLEALRSQAEAGDALAQLNLGAAYDHAMGVPRNIEKALHWYQQAAEQGLAEAQFNLAHLLVEAEISPAAAAEWMAKAANQGMLDAQFLMGVIHAEGLGVEQDMDKARQWLEQAIEQGSGEARDYLDNRMPGG